MDKPAQCNVHTVPEFVSSCLTSELHEQLYPWISPKPPEQSVVTDVAKQ